MENLDILSLSNGKSRNIKIGELTPEVIQLLNLDLKPQNINVWSPRIQEHCEKHKTDYTDADSYSKAVKSIPLIIQQPDYVGIHPNGNIQYIKKLDDISLIGVKVIKNDGLLFRTIFPITEDKLDYYLKTHKIFPTK